jgi:hypothetical protein
MAQGTSRYALKVKAGNQMYGPGCCPHKRSDAEMQALRSRLRASGVRMPAIPYSNKAVRHASA